MKLDMRKLEQENLLIHGCFRLNSGRHSRTKIDFDRASPEFLEQCAEALAARLDIYEIDAIVAIARGGVAIAELVQQRLRRRRPVVLCVAEKGEYLPIIDPSMLASIENANFAIIDDTNTTGGSIRRTIQSIRSYEQSVERDSFSSPARVAAACVIVDRGIEDLIDGIPLISLGRVSIPTFAENECPWCNSWFQPTPSQ